MKRWLLFTLSLLLVCFSALPCFAGEWVFVAQPLTAEETKNLAALHQAILDTYGIDACFVINYDYEGGDAFKTYARAYLKEHAQSKDALVFAVSSTTYYMNTTGKAGDYLQESDLDDLYEAIRGADERGEQYNAAAQFYAALSRLLASRAAAVPTTAAPSSTPPSTEPPVTAAPGFSEATTAPGAAVPADAREILPGSVYIPEKITPVRGDRLVDQADLIPASDETALRAKLNAISEELQFDVVLVTAEHIGSRTPMAFADDYFDYNGFGFGDDHDGVCFLVSMAERDWWISTCGFGETALSDDYFMDIVRYSKVISALKDGDYSASFNAYADMVGDFVREAQTGEPYSPRHRYQDWRNKVIGVGLSLLLGLIVAGIVTWYMKQHYVASVQQKREAGAYLVGAVQYGEGYDRFRSSVVNRTRRVSESSASSSGSSSSSGGHHTSSSGYSHGGGGGKF